MSLNAPAFFFDDPVSRALGRIDPQDSIVRYAQSVADLVGNTPLVRLNRVTDGIAATVLAKIEYFNPGGSAKDRIAANIIDAAERDGLLRPGGTIVEPTSGNTGVGLALVAQQRGYRCVFVVPGQGRRGQARGPPRLRRRGRRHSDERRAGRPNSYYSVSDRLVREIPGAFKPNQYANPTVPAAITRPRVPRSGATPRVR